MLARVSILVLGALSVALSVDASAVPTTHVFSGTTPVSRIDYSPPLTQPKGGEVYIAGQSITVAWDNTVVYPLENVTTTADIVLGYTTPSSTSLNLFYTLKLDVPLYAPNPSSIDVQLPANLTTRSTYLLVLLGSTHDRTPEFTILSNPLATVTGKKRLA